MKILVLDIENSPNLAHVWDIWSKSPIYPSMVIEPKEIMCFAAQWIDADEDEEVIFYSTFWDGRAAMVAALHRLLDEADAVVHYNGRRHDIKMINRAMWKGGYKPPSPYKQIDLYMTVRSKFSFESNSLDFVCREMGIGQKADHGMDTLRKCVLESDEQSWKDLRDYNKQDVRLTRRLYWKLLPWIDRIPHHAPTEFDPSDPAAPSMFCPACGSADIARQGFAHTTVSVYQRYRCRNCGKWSRGTRRINKGGTGITEVAT